MATKKTATMIRSKKRHKRLTQEIQSEGIARKFRKRRVKETEGLTRHSGEDVIHDPSKEQTRPSNLSYSSVVFMSNDASSPSSPQEYFTLDLQVICSSSCSDSLEFILSSRADPLTGRGKDPQEEAQSWTSIPQKDT